MALKGGTTLLSIVTSSLFWWSKWPPDKGSLSVSPGGTLQGYGRVTNMALWNKMTDLVLNEGGKQEEKSTESVVKATRSVVYTVCPHLQSWIVRWRRKAARCGIGMQQDHLLQLMLPVSSHMFVDHFHILAKLHLCESRQTWLFSLQTEMCWHN